MICFIITDTPIHCLTLNLTYVSSYLGCMPGYSGVNCSLQCPYPSYGVNCQKICNCIQELCDVSTGCQQTTTGN